MTVNMTDVAAPQLPAASLARTHNVCCPDANDSDARTCSLSESNAPSTALIAVPNPPPGSPPSNHSPATTFDNPSDAVPVTTEPPADTTNPLTTGPAVSTVNVTDVAAPQLPAASLARTHNVCAPTPTTATHAPAH